MLGQKGTHKYALGLFAELEPAFGSFFQYDVMKLELEPNLLFSLTFIRKIVTRNIPTHLLNFR